MLSQTAMEEIGLPGAIATLFLALVAIVKWIQGRYAAEVAELRVELKQARDELKRATEEKIADRIRIAKLEASEEAREVREEHDRRPK